MDSRVNTFFLEESGWDKEYLNYEQQTINNKL